MKRVLFLTSVYSDLTGGTKYNKNLISRIAGNDDFEVDVLTDKDFGIENGMRWYDGIKLYKNLYKKISEYDIFIVDSSKYTQLAFHIGKMRRRNKSVKFISILHHYTFHTKTDISKAICKRLELRFLNKMDVLIYASEYTYNLRAQYINKKVENVLIKVPVQRYKTKRVGWGSCTLSTIGGTGYGNRKGHLEMVEALKMVEDKIKGFSLKIMGKYDELDDGIRNVIVKLNEYGLKNNVIYTGRVSEEEKYEILDESKFYVFPSQYEGYGLSVLEAMSAGLPVIAFNNSAMPTVIKNGVTGFLCENIKEFAEKIELLYNDSKLCEDMGKNAISYVDSCQTVQDFEKEVDKFIKDELKEENL